MTTSAPPAVAVMRPLRDGELESVFNAERREQGAEWLARQLRGELYVAVAEVDGEPVGTRCLDPVCGREWGHAFLFGASVRPAWRSRGIGAQLDAHLEEVARSLGFRTLRCVNAKRNARALRWHEKLGYRTIGETTLRWTAVDGREVEVECWELEREIPPLNTAS